MPELEELKHTIESVQDIQAIVRTMKTLAAASIYTYERARDSMTDYNRTIELGLQVLLAEYGVPEQTAAGAAPDTGVVVFGSDRGLCGRFNEELVEFTLASLEEQGIAQTQRHILAVGARAEARIEEQGQTVRESFFVPGSVAGITATVQAILRQLDAWREAHAVSRVLLFYNRQRRGGQRRPEVFPLLPLDPQHFYPRPGRQWPSRRLPTYSMERHTLLAAYIRQYLFAWVFHGCASSLASENASRLASMQAAERNISEHLAELGIQFSRQRQEVITEELLEVVSGFQVLTGQ